MKETFLLSPTQEYIWLDQSINKGSSKYNIGGFAQIQGPINKDYFEETIRQLFMQCQILRASFDNQVDGFPLLKFESNLSLNLEYLDFSANENPSFLARSWMEDDMCIPFDVCKSPLYKFVLIKADEDNFFCYGKIHHLLADGWAFSLLFRKISEIYSCIEKKLLCLCPREFLFTDYLAEAQGYKMGLDYKSDAFFWSEKFKKDNVTIFKDITHPSATLPIYYDNKITRRSIVFPRKHFIKLQGFAEEVYASVFHIILSVLYLYLGRVNRTDKIIVGVPVLNRSGVRQKNTIGPLFNIIPIEVSGTGSISFRELTLAIRNEVKKCYRHQKFPFGELVKIIQESGFGIDGLFDLRLSYEKHDYGIQFGDHTARITALPNTRNNTKLSVYVREYSDNQDIIIDFDTKVGIAEVDGLILNFERLLLETCSNPDHKISEFDLISREELRMIENINQNSSKYFVGSDFLTLFEEQARIFPCRIAVVYEGLELTYSELHYRSNQLAGLLLTKGVRKGDLVPVCMERSEELLICLLGIMKAGAVYIPIDPEQGINRMQYILEESDPQLIIADPTGYELLQGLTDSNVLNLQVLEVEVSQMPGEDILTKIEPQDLAYIMYTSGSSGHPKGVMIEHGSLGIFLYAISKKIQAQDMSSLLAITTYCFDISCLEFFLPLAFGKKVIVAKRGVAADGRLLRKAIADYKPSIVQATPNTWRLLLSTGWRNEEGVHVLVGGEALPEQLKMELLASGANVIWNLYGPTETTVWATAAKINSIDKVNIGQPLEGTSVYVTDHFGKLLPPGRIGELFIGGPQVARGYFKKPDLSSQSFIPCSFPGSSGGKIYKTGDLVRLLPCGNIEFIGRVDEQVKVKGFRIELSEIDHALSRIPGVKQAVASVRKDENGDNFIVAYLMPVVELSVADIKKCLNGFLPKYMIPAAIVKLASFPLTYNGKIDKKKLPDPDFSIFVNRDYVSPESPMERKLVSIWQEVLGLDCIGVTDNFFDLGGHSLKANMLVNLLNKNFSLDVLITDIFSHPTIRELSLKLSELEADKFDFIDL